MRVPVTSPIEEIPITYHEREGEATLESFRDGWRHVRFMLLNARTTSSRFRRYPRHLWARVAVVVGIRCLTGRCHVRLRLGNRRITALSRRVSGRKHGCIRNPRQ